MGRAEAKIALIAVFETEKLFAVVLPAAALLPKLSGRGYRHQQLLRPRSIHLLADNLFDLADDFERQGKIIIHAAADLANETGAHQEFMTDHIGVCWVFF